HRDGRLRQREEREVRVTEEVAQSGSLDVVTPWCCEVEPGAEERPRTREHDRPHGVVLAGRSQRGPEIAEQGLVLGVGRGAVEGEHAHAALVLRDPDRAHPRDAARPPRRRALSAASVAMSIAVHASARPPSAIARSAAGVTQWAANSGWWFTAG